MRGMGISHKVNTMGECLMPTRQDTANDELLIQRFEAALLNLDRLAAADLLSQEIKQEPMQVVERIIVPALESIGRAWEDGRLALSQIYMGGRICEELVDSLFPAAKEAHRQQPKMALAVLDDYHLLGKRMVYATIRSGGYALDDYGRMEAAALAQRAGEAGVEVLFISALMLASALRVRQVRNELERMGCHVKIMVGGAPFRLDERLWQEVGADAMGRNASDALPQISKWIGAQP